MAVETRPGGSAEPRDERSFDLRERKRSRMRLMIQAEALRLFDERGYESTTIEEIAHAAAISPRTFFRYFPSKEDVVIWDEFDPIALELVESRPDDEPLAQTFRAVIRETLGGLYRRDPERLLRRVRLSTTVPELRARLLEEQATGIEVLAPLMARRDLGHDDELSMRVIGAALLSAVMVALERWQEADGEPDLLVLLDEAIDALVRGVSSLEPGSSHS